MKKGLIFLIVVLAAWCASAQEVYITGYIDSSCPQAKGRTLEIYVSGTVDLSAWNLVRQSNGNGYAHNINISGLGTLTDEYAYITNNIEIFQQEFEVGEASILQTGAINDNGDDAFQLVDQFGNLIDRFGEEGVQPTSSSPWYHKKTYYYRKSGESPNHGNFNPNNWIFGAINLLLGEGLCNDGEAFGNIVPFGSFDPFLCEPITALPYIEDFENSIPPNIHNCATIENEVNSPPWEIAFLDKNGFNSKVLQYQASSEPANAWFFTRGITLETDIEYELTYRYGNNDPLSQEKLQIALGNSNDSEEMNILKIHSQISSGKAKRNRILFDVNSGDVYYIGFHASSEADQNELYVDDIQIGLAPNCLTPLDLKSDELTAITAQLSWRDDNENATASIVYGESGFNPAVEGEVIYVEESTETTLENLLPDTIYDVYVKSHCSDVEESTYAEVLHFKTLCSPTQTPFLENFESMVPPELSDCSSVENGSAGNNWETAEIQIAGFDGKVLRYQADENNPARAWFFTRGVDLDAETDYQLSYVFGNNNPETTEKLKVSFGTSPTADKMNHELTDYSIINQGVATPGEHIFSVETDTTYYFGFLAYADANQGELYLDEIEIKPAPSCLRPTAITIQNLEAFSAEVIWTDANSVSNYEVIYGEYGFDPETEGQSLFVEENTQVYLENLESGTTYQVFIKTHCTPTDESEHSFAATFTTDCTIQDVPFVQDFESAIVPSLPNCATSDNAGNGNNWETYDESQDSNPIMNSKVLRYKFDIFNSANAWYFTNGINLQTGINYQISYRFANNTANTNFFEKLKVGFGSVVAAADMQIIADHPHISDAIPESHMVVFSVPADGVYYFGFNAYSNFNASVLYVDDIEIDLGPICPSPTNLYYTNLSHESVDFTWEGYQTTSQWQVKYGFYGFDPQSSGINSFEITGEPEIHISGLQTDTFYDVYVRSNCGEGEFSDWEGPKTFKTKITPPSNNLLCDAQPLEWNQECAEGDFANLGAFSEPNEPEACFNYPGKTVWFSFQAPENGEVTLLSDFFDPVLTSQLAVFEAPTDCADPLSLGAEIACAGYSSNIFISNLIPGETYYLQVAANSNQAGTFCIEVQVDPNMAVENNLFEELSLYPNPVKNELFIQAQSPIENLVLFDFHRKKVMSQHPNSTETKLSISTLASGIYFLQIALKGKLRTFKVVKE